MTRSPVGSSAPAPRRERDDVDYFVTALDEGLRCAAAAIGEFGLGGLVPRGPTAA